ncbi:MAG: NAD-dependent epimerase/dehydratase family protein [Alphaproteobacteria bacterium]
MKVLVTGASGRLGRRIVALLAKTCEVTAFDAKESESGARHHIQGDILDFDAVKRAMRGQDAVIHLAAALVAHKLPDELLVRTNVMGTWHVFAAAAETGVGRVVHTSSETATGVVFADPSRPPLYLPVDEDHPLHPAEPYGTSKAMSEEIAKMFALRGGMTVTVIRPTLVATETITPKLAALGTDPRNIDLWGWADPEDVAEAYRLALGRSGSPYDVFFISAPNTLSDTPTLDLLRTYYGKLPEVRRPEVYQRDPHAGVFSIARAQARLGFAPHRDWRRLKA